MANNLLVVDLSHYDPADSYSKMKDSGIVGVIYKATQGTSYTDDTYNEQEAAAKRAGLLWGAYHFADGTNPDDQANHFAAFTSLDSEDLFCLDWEDNGSSTMSESDAKIFVATVEDLTGGRTNECVLYSGNTAKEALGSKVDSFWSARRLWLAQYTSGTPTCQNSWDKWWLWQYTDTGKVPGNSNQVDCNYYDGSVEQLASEWAHGTLVPPTPLPPPLSTVTVTVDAPKGVKIVFVQTSGQQEVSRSRRRSRAN